MYQIERIDLLIRQTPPPRMMFSLGKQTPGQPKPKPAAGVLAHVRVILRGPDGETAFGASGDRMSVRWLDKRPGRSNELKHRELVELLYRSRDIYMAAAPFESPFEYWLGCYKRVMDEGRKQGQEDLTSCYASAILERAILDAFCRLHGESMFEMVQTNQLGVDLKLVHPELADMDFRSCLPGRPKTRIRVRHTVGLDDPLTSDDLPADQRVNDGLPETLQEYIETDGITYFKVKISGDVQADMKRLTHIWDVVPKTPETGISLDANEAYTELDAFLELTKRMQKQLPGLFEHILYIEQPLTRELTFDPRSEKYIRQISTYKPVIIDEADSDLNAFKRAFKLGYQGTSCKNCKGFFKSLLHRALFWRFRQQDKNVLLSAEDLQNLPIAPLHQDYVAISILGIDHCERNGHHYNYGLSMLTEKEKQTIAKYHRDMYVQRGDEWFLNIRDGFVETASLQCPGFGIVEELDWDAMTPMPRG